MCQPTQYIAVRDSFSYFGEQLTKRSEREFKTIAMFLRSQFSQELQTAKLSCDESYISLFDKIIDENVRKQLPKLLGRNFTRGRDESIARLSTRIRSELERSLPQLFILPMQESSPEVPGLWRRIDSTPATLVRSSTTELTSGRSPILGKIEDAALPEAFDTSEEQGQEVFDRIIAELKEKEEELTGLIYQKNEEIEELQEILNIVPPEPSKAPRTKLLTGKKPQKTIHFLSLDQQKELRIKHMQSYIRKRNKELADLDRQSGILQQRLHSDIRNLEAQQDFDVSAPDLSTRMLKKRLHSDLNDGLELDNVEEGDFEEINELDLSLQALGKQMEEKETFGELPPRVDSLGSAKSKHPIFPEILKLVPRSLKIKRARTEPSQ